MLVQFAARNFVLIEELVLVLEPGFNVLTGETGAGKSLVVDALGLVLGARASGDVVRAGADEAEVQALFDISENDRARSVLVGFGLGADAEQGELLLRRVVTPQGRSRAFINGRLATAGQLAELARTLCDVASQHESVSLTDAGTHLEYLDAFGGLGDECALLAADVLRTTELAADLEALRERSRTRAEREELITWTLREIDEVSPVVNEDTDLLSERARLRHAARLGDVVANAGAALYETEGAVCDVLARVEADLSSAAALDASLAPLADSIGAARAELVEASRTLLHYAGTVEVNPARLADVEERLFKLEKLFRKHAANVDADGNGATDLVGAEAVLAKKASLESELRAFEASDADEKSLVAAFEQAMRTASERARSLSAKRRRVGEKLGKAIGRELGDLGMGGARILVDVTPAACTKGLMVDGAHLSPKGMDKVEFLIAPNKGEEPRPLRRIASGGELSRALLAIKRVLAKNGPAGLYVFDEVDTGTSGAVAEVIGRKMADVAKHHQVLSITHLAQIAALADVQFVVGKTVSGDRTHVSVRKLRSDERVGEIARMIGGVTVGQAAKKAAKELLSVRV
jgi:DNA repair protein RecN (Recombination protein N)